MVFSFDVFDTVVTRSLARPGDVFRLMQEMLFSPEKEDIPENLRLQFPLVRKRAERKARRLSGKEDITIKDIYDQLGKTCGISPQTSHQLMSLEMSLEEKVICPVIPVVRHIQDLLASGKKVVFISDMYLPADFVRQVLNKAGIPMAGLALYMSGEIGLRKTSGRLFKYLLEKEAVAARELVHFGDNMISDVLVPSRLGIQIVNVEEIRPPLSWFLNSARSS